LLGAGGSTHSSAYTGTLTAYAAAMATRILCEGFMIVILVQA
jgi:hypothetical protein